jgi:hypothetical protein
MMMTEWVKTILRLCLRTKCLTCMPSV